MSWWGLPKLMAFSAAGWAALRLSEGHKKTVYLDIVGIPTVCMGTTEGLARADVGKRFGAEACDKRDRAAVLLAENAVRHNVKVKLTQAQFDALVSFTYNVGAGALRKSTLLTVLNRGDYKGAAAQIRRWVYAGGYKVRGLAKRREEEARPFEDVEAWQ